MNFILFAGTNPNDYRGNGCEQAPVSGFKLLAENAPLGKWLYRREFAAAKFTSLINRGQHELPRLSQTA